MTLIEIALVVAILVTIAGFVVPNFIRRIERERLPGSARKLRSLIALVRANAAFDGTQYRIRFPLEDELDALGGTRQPMVEREDDPIHEPEVFNLVTAPWAVGNTLLGGIRCAEVRLGRPTIEQLRARELRSQIEEALEEAFEDFDPRLPPLLIQPDGGSDWVTFLLTDAPDDVAVEDLDDAEEFGRIEVISSGLTGLTWLQRPLYEEEVDLFEDKGWPIVLRQDFLNPRVLTEDDVLELRDIPQTQR